MSDKESMKDFLTKTQIENLVRAHRQAKEKREADRIKTVLCLNTGYSYEEIANILLLNDSTLRTYYQEYQSGDLAGLLTDKHQGSEKKLNSAQLEQLDAHLDEHLYNQAKEIVAYVKEQHGVTYTVRGMRGLLGSMGYVYKKPKKVPGKADRAQQEEFVAAYQALKREMKEADRIWFLDGVHPRHNVVVAHGWIRKGKERELKSNSGRAGININGAVNLSDYSVVRREDERINAESTLQLIKAIEARQREGQIWLVMDNARYNYAKVVRDYIEANPRLEARYLPPYSPNLNVIERLWLLMQRKILYNRYYASYDDFTRAIRDFLDHVNMRYRQEMETMLTDNFHLIAA